MIYLKESFDIHPASPATRDRFVGIVEDELLAANAPHGARLVGAWFAHEEWFSQIIHVTEFDDLGAHGAWCEAARSDAPARKVTDALAALARERRQELLEPLGAIPTASLHAAIESSRDEPAGVYTFAILEVEVGAMERFSAMLGAAKDALPIVASWRDHAGNPDRVIDLWKGDIGRTGYRPSNDQENAFFGPLREVAPRERMMRLHPLPYSPLR